jgi:maltooligosyltrehalose trehalohydrolase
MPVAAFPGTRGWGYDGVLPFAPHAAYGRPDDLKRLVDAAHARGLMVLLDVVYNHFGPEGNYLHAYAPQFFDEGQHTPWGAALDFDGPHGRAVRDFFIHNALYWIDEYRLDGLRLDAVHAIVDESRPDIVDELAAAVGRHADDARHVHIVLENDRNESRRLVRAAGGATPLATAQWNDDFHHALHVLVTGERDGYYADYADDAPRAFARALAEGFVYQGQASPYRDGAHRGEPSGALPPAAFVSFAQNHDQVGNRAFGERLDAIADRAKLRTAIACMLLAPQVPMLFMGEEFAAATPFLYFADFGPDLAAAVTRGRREEFARFERFAADAARIPDPMAPETFVSCKLRWRHRESEAGAARLAFYRACLAARREHVVPLLPAITHGGTFGVEQSHAIRVRWPVGGGTRTLTLLASFADRALAGIDVPEGVVAFADPAGAEASLRGGELPAHAVIVALSESR